jgi:hypothetical protein
MCEIEGVDREREGWAGSDREQKGHGHESRGFGRPGRGGRKRQGRGGIGVKGGV